MDKSLKGSPQMPEENNENIASQQAQETLRVSEIRYRRLFETARDGILILDADTVKITDANPFMVELLGYSRDEFLGKELWEIGLLKDAEASKEAYQVLREHGYLRYEDLPLQTKNGKLREVEFISNVYTENGHQVIQCNIRDITTRKQSERALRESEERFRFLAESMPQKIFTALPNGEVDYFNQQWMEFTGLPLVGIKDQDWTRFIHPDCVEESIRCWQHSIDTDEPFQFEHRFRGTDGIYRWHLTRAHAMHDAAGNVLMWIGSSTDINDQKQAEEGLKRLMILEQAARVEAEAANRTKDEFLAIASHELRTPLSAILGWAIMLRTGRVDEETTVRGLESVERNAKAQAQLIEDILDLSRFNAGKLHLEVSPLEIPPIIHAAIESQQPAMNAKSIQIRMHLDPDMGLVSVDEQRLQQVIGNLISNAIKFTPDGGQIEVRLERANSQAQITVSDTGKGISADFLPYLFDHFRQADSSTTRRHGGLGLGLAIVRHIVMLHGGTVQAESRGEGQGSTFTVRLPLAAASKVEAFATDESQLPSINLERVNPFSCPPELFGLQVMAIDDDPDTLGMLRTVLEQGGAQVRTYLSATAALTALTDWWPDALISDLAMPDEDGYALIGKVRALEQERGARLPAMALSAYNRGEDRTHVLAAGYDLFVPKPVEPAELLATLANLVGEIRKGQGAGL